MMRSALLVAVIGIVSAQTQGALFVPAPSSPVVVGKGSGTVLFADLNGDGHLDMLTRHLLERVLAVRIGDGRGHFAAGVAPTRFDFEVGAMVLGDFNTDGVVDLVATPVRKDIADVYLGSRDATFRRAPGSPFTITDADEPYNKRTIHALDMNEDGHLDIVTANGRRRNTFAVLHGDGRGGFTRGPEVAVDSGQDGYVLAFADFNGDRHLDVVSVSRKGYEDTTAGRVIVRLGDGTGNFSPTSQSPFDAAVGPRSVTVADFTGDRHPDIAIASHDGRVSILTNDGRGVFAAAKGSPHALGIDGHSVVAADVDRDGRQDLVCANVDKVNVFLGTATGFVAAPGSPFRAGPGSYFAGVADVNRDGKLDIAASSFEGDAVTVLLQR